MSQPVSAAVLLCGNAQSVPDTVNNWLGGLCAVGTCSNASLASVAATVTSGCASDLSAFNVSVGAGLQQTITQIVQQVYPTARSIMCLKDNASSKFCATEMLSSIETLTGKLSASSLNLQTILSDFQNLVASAANLACTNCTKAAFSLAAPLTAQFPQASSAIDTLCGAGFAGKSII
ncbi:unnamed protein product [Mycena citricolor]|uniref:DUF7729 domain-containing protein n=1 Tax=Mycena citricolor TaxID=2018698 RepID=A0AAD2Q238_9AGAR|nr:unnamed protein product [Mycena citricolor]